jgi:hypothetical protein
MHEPKREISTNNEEGQSHRAGPIDKTYRIRAKTPPDADLPRRDWVRRKTQKATGESPVVAGLTFHTFSRSTWR